MRAPSVREVSGPQLFSRPRGSLAHIGARVEDSKGRENGTGKRIAVIQCFICCDKCLTYQIHWSIFPKQAINELKAPPPTKINRKTRQLLT